MKEVITIEELRASIFERLTKIDSKDIVVQIHTLLQTEEDRAGWNDLTAAQKTSIEAGLADAGRPAEISCRSHEKVRDVK
jgi:hypothetical protein